MADLDVDFGGDLTLGPDGDLSTIDGVDLDNQHIERRLLTAVKGYIWHLNYAAGLPQRIGQPAIAKNIQALVRAQLVLEATVSALPPPTITVSFDPDNAGICVIEIDYTNAISNTTVSISLEVPTSR